MTLLEVSGLAKSYRHRGGAFWAVDDVSFSLARGRTLALVGESGAGKSTAGRLVLRLVEPDRGSVFFDGVQVRDLGSRELRELRPRMQMIFQDPYTSLDPRMTIGAGVAEPLRLHQRMNRSDRERKVTDLLLRVGLGAHHVTKVPAELSGGQLQRVAIARALILDPAMIVCDEPVSALDVSIRAQIVNLLLDLQEERELSLLFISHDLSLVEVVAHEVAIMRAGQIIEHGEVATVFAAPREDYSRRLLDAVPGRRRVQSGGDGDS